MSRVDWSKVSRDDGIRKIIHIIIIIWIDGFIICFDIIDIMGRSEWIIWKLIIKILNTI